jgi:hypothetical protein
MPWLPSKQLQRYPKLWTLKQRQLEHENSKSEPKPWPPNINNRKAGNSPWLPAHPVEKLLQSLGLKLLQCGKCGKWAYGSRCNQIEKPQTPPVDGNENINPPPAGKINKLVIYIDDDALPYYKYFDEGTSTATTEGGDPLYLGSEYSDDDDPRECGLGGY